MSFAKFLRTRFFNRTLPRGYFLTLPVPIPDEEGKLTEIFTFKLLCGASEGFIKAFMAFIKPFEAQ